MRIKELRKISGLTQKEIAEKLGVYDTVVSRYERGLCYPSVENLLKLADLFSVSTDTVLGRDSDLVDMKTLSANQQKLVKLIVEKFSDEKIAQLLGYAENL